jgi:hypothetical protein
MTILTILLGTIILIFLVRALACRTNFNLPRQETILLLKIHVALVGLLILTIGLSFFNIYWRGYGSTTIVLLMTTTSGLILYWFHSQQEISKSLRTVFLVLLIFGVPITELITWDSCARREYSLFYNDNTYRLEQTFKGILAPASLPDLFIKQGLIERKYELRGEYINEDEIKKIEIKNYDNKILSVIFYYSADTVYGLKNPIVINVKTE